MFTYKGPILHKYVCAAALLLLKPRKFKSPCESLTISCPCHHWFSQKKQPMGLLSTVTWYPYMHVGKRERS